MVKKAQVKPSTEPTRDQSGVAPLKGQNVIVGGRRTSMRLEPSMWDALVDIARREKMSMNDLCSQIEERRLEQCRLRTQQAGQEPNPNEAVQKDGVSKEVTLTSAVRVFIAAYYRNAATDSGHSDAGHGTGDPFKGTPLDLPSSNEGGDSSSDGGGGPPPGAAPFGSHDPQAVSASVDTARFAVFDA